MSEQGTKKEECKLFALTQYECAPENFRVRCWPLERIFRQCGNGPAVEVTNLTLPRDEGEPIRLDPRYLDAPPKGKNWSDIR